MDNSGDGPLQVPGFRDMPIDYELKIEQCFAHGALPNHNGCLRRATRLNQHRSVHAPSYEEAN